MVGENATIKCIEATLTQMNDFGWLTSSLKPTYTNMRSLVDDLRYDDTIFEMISQKKYAQVTPPSPEPKNRKRSTGPQLHLRNQHLMGSQLVLINVTERDSGFYTCLASNNVGLSWVAMYLEVIPYQTWDIWIGKSLINESYMIGINCPHHSIANAYHLN